MPWLTYSGQTPAEASSGYTLHPGGSVAGFTRRKNTADMIAEALQAAAPLLHDYMKQRQNDKIANYVQNMANPPRAQAVDQVGATYDPQLAARQGLNSPTEPAATQPFTGGAAGMTAMKLYQDILDKRQADLEGATKDEQDSRYKEAQIHHLYAADKATRAGASYVSTPYGSMTAHQWGLDPRNTDKPKPASEQRAQARFDAQMADSYSSLNDDVTAASGHSLGDWTGATKKHIAGDQFVATNPATDTEMTMPAAVYQTALGRYNKLQGGNGGNSPTAAAPQTNTAQVGKRVRQGGVVYEFDGTSWNAVEL